MILSKKESKILPQISFFVRWGSYLISVVVVIFLISNSLFIENRIRIVLNEINEFLFGIKQDYAVSQIQDIPIFLKGAITGALTPIDLKSISLNIEQEKLLNIYNTVENRSNREYLNAELMILDEYGTDSILKAKVRAKGDRSLHWEDVNNMSFRVNLRGDDRLFGLEEFSIQKPLLRNYIWEYLIAEVFRQEGLLALKNEPIKFLVNGDRRGIYSVEEAPSKITIERQKRKNGPIYGLDEEVSIGLDSILDPYEEKDWIGLPIYELSKSSLYSEFINAQAGLPFTSKNFDMDEWARSMALHDLFGSYHGSVPKSVRFYFNPVIGKYQPLLFDIHIGAGNWKKFVVLDFILQPNLSSCEWLCDYKKFYLGFLKNKDFLDSYVMYLEKYSSPEFINKVKFIFDSKFKKLNHEFYATFSPSDDIFNRGNSLYLFKFGPIQKKGKVIRDRIKLYKDRDPIITGEDGKNFKYELNQFELIFDSEVQVSNLNNFEMKGSKWNLNEKSIYIFSGNTVLTGISKDEPLVIAGPAMFVQNGGTILMDNVVLSSLNELNVSNRNWSGAFNIFDSDAKIENLTIKNVSAEDAINFVNSTYRIGLLKIDGARSDGLDSDFSTGTIENIDCKFIGNDCLDISETKVSLLNANIVDVLDKGISAGENSNISVENLKLTNTGIGVVSKDGSILKVKNISFKNVDLPIAVFNKKPSYADPTIDIVNVLSDEDLFSYISENATISMPTYIKTEVYSSEEIEGLMYGTVYGVATEKK